MIENEFIYPFEIATFDAGYAKNIRLSSILKFQQEAGEQHLNSFNIGFNKLYDKGLVFVVTNTCAVIKRMPKLQEKMKIITYNRGIKGIKFNRSYNWVDQNGETVIESSSSFALVDAIGHSLVRPSALDVALPEFLGRTNAAGIPKKIKLPDNMANESVKKVLYSEVDYNGHLNNTFYADFITDYIPFSMDNKEIVCFNIDFAKESVLGDEILIKTAVSDNTVYFQGIRQSNDCFRASCTFKAN